MDDLTERGRAFEIPPSDLDAVTHRARRIRRGRVVSGGVAAAIVLVGIAVPLALFLPRTDQRGELFVKPRRVASLGVSMKVPTGWTVTRDPLGGRTRPEGLLLVGSWASRSIGACQVDPPTDGALVWIEEYRTGKPARPSRFPPRRPGSFATVRPKGGFSEPACAYGEGINGWTYAFRDGGRYFEAHVAFPSRSSEGIIDQAYAVLDSLRVEPLPPETCAYWSHPACPEGQWLQLVVQDGGGVIEGDTHSAYVVRMGGTADQFYLWAFEAPPEDGSRPATGTPVIGEVDGVTVYADEQRGYWEANGVMIWFESGPHGELRPGIDVLGRLVRASLQIPYPPELFEP